MSKIAAVVVTFNRLEMLKECLESLLHQTQALDFIVLIDNASTDGTEEWVSNTELKSYQNFRYFRLSKNTGGAGGFHEGMKQALLLDIDWVWVMDDDVAPLPDCLEIMLSYKEISKCIHPRKKYRDGSFYFWEGYVDYSTGFEVKLSDKSFPEKEWTTVNYACFEGMLVHKDLIMKVGLPETKYFLNRDDTDFGYKASRYTNVIYLRDALMIKLRNEMTLNNPSPLHLFLSFRNSVGYFSRKVSNNKILYALVALCLIIRCSFKQFFLMKPKGLVAIWYGFYCGLFDKWGGEVKYIKGP